MFPLFGKDKIIVYASDKPLGRTELQAIGSGLGMVKNKNDFERSLRAIRPVASEAVGEAKASCQNFLLIPRQGNFFNHHARS